MDSQRFEQVKRAMAAEGLDALVYRYHEPTPLICPGGETVLEAGMVHTVEPGIYIPGMGGIRLEENVVVTANGCEFMGPCEKDMEVSA